MNPYALPSFSTFPILIVLALSVILQNPRDKTGRLLCFLLLISALQTFSTGMLHLSTSEAEANSWNKWPYIFGLPSMILLMEFIQQISGGSQRLKERMLLIRIGIQRWVLYFLLFIAWIIIIVSDQIVAPVKYYSPTGWEHQYGPFVLPMMILGSYIVAYQIVIISRGIKSAPNSIERKLRITMLITVVLWQGFLFIPGVIIPWLFKLQTHSLSAIGIVPICFVLTYGFMRSQWETIQDLNIGLRGKNCLAY